MCDNDRKQTNAASINLVSHFRVIEKKTQSFTCGEAVGVWGRNLHSGTQMREA